VAELVAAKEEAERANRAKSDFISGVSHELRTPLNAIIGFSKLLLNPRVGPAERRPERVPDGHRGKLGTPARADQRHLDLSKIEAGKMTLSPAPFLLAEVLEQSLAVVREKGPPAQPAPGDRDRAETLTLAPMVADQRKIKQVLYNLLSNAVKFTPDGGSVVLSAACDGESHVILSVRDTGIGIPPEDQDRIFDAFEQVDSSYARQKQGTGLGLALTRRLVSLHGATSVWKASSARAARSLYRLPRTLLSQARRAQPRLRVSPSLPPRRGNGSPDTPGACPAEHAPLRNRPKKDMNYPTLQGRRVLVIEDTEQNMRLFRAILQMEGAEVLEADGARVGIAIAEREHPDVILMDIQMPDMDGLAATRCSAPRH
jgi:signal transduction histidine kinase